MALFFFKNMLPPAALFLQQQDPAILPPLWQLVTSQVPLESEPRLLQQQGVDLDAVLEQARSRVGVSRAPLNLNQKSLAELLLGFFEFYKGKQVESCKLKHGQQGCSARLVPWLGDLLVYRLAVVVWHL